MSKLEQVLDDCLGMLAQGSSVQDCLDEHPEHRAQLSELLGLVKEVEKLKPIAPSLGSRGAMRTQLLTQIMPPRKSMFSRARRFALALITLIALFLVTGTAQAQSALPGELLYPWKLTSEVLAGSVVRDPLGYEFFIAERRIAEIEALIGFPEEQRIAQDMLLDILQGFENYIDETDRIRIEIFLNETLRDQVIDPSSDFSPATIYPDVQKEETAVPPQTPLPELDLDDLLTPAVP